MIEGPLQRPATKGVIKWIVANTCVSAISFFVTYSSSGAVRGTVKIRTDSGNPGTFDSKSLISVNNLAITRTSIDFICVMNVDCVIFFIANTFQTQRFAFVRIKALA